MNKTRNDFIKVITPHIPKIQNPNCTDKNVKVFLVSYAWYQEFEKYIDPNMNPRFPGKMQIKCLFDKSDDKKDKYIPTLEKESIEKFLEENNISDNKIINELDNSQLDKSIDQDQSLYSNMKLLLIFLLYE